MLWETCEKTRFLKTKERYEKIFEIQKNQGFVMFSKGILINWIWIDKQTYWFSLYVEAAREGIGGEAKRARPGGWAIAFQTRLCYEKTMRNPWETNIFKRLVDRLGPKAAPKQKLWRLQKYLKVRRALWPRARQSIQQCTRLLGFVLYRIIFSS